MSIVNHTYKHCFIHNPKTAGSSMERMPWIGGTGHKTAIELCPPSNYFTWCFVRHPLDRFVSAYASIAQNEPEFKAAFPHLYFAAICIHSLAQTRAHFARQVTYVKQCNFVGRFENLQNDWKNVTTVVRCISSQPLRDRLPVVNRCAAKPTPDEVQEIAAKVKRFYAVDYDAFGYE